MDYRNSCNGSEREPKSVVVRLDDRFVNAIKLDTRLRQIFGSQSQWSCSWRRGEYVIEDAPFQLSKVSPQKSSIKHVLTVDKGHIATLEAI